MVGRVCRQIRAYPASRASLQIPFREAPAQLLAAGGRPHVEPLHFAGRRVRAAAGLGGREAGAPAGQQEPPHRRRVFTGQARQLRLESLEVEVDAETVGIFPEKQPGFCGKGRHGSSSPPPPATGPPIDTWSPGSPYYTWSPGSPY